MKRLKGMIDEMGYTVVEMLITLGVIAMVIAIILFLITQPGK